MALSKIKQTKPEVPAKDCAHDAGWRFETRSADGKKIYGHCPRCKTIVEREA